MKIWFWRWTVSVVSYRSDALLQGDDLGVASQLDLFTGEGIKFLADEFHGQAAISVVRVKTISVTKRRKDSFSTNCL